VSDVSHRTFSEEALLYRYWKTKATGWPMAGHGGIAVLRVESREDDGEAKTRQPPRLGRRINLDPCGIIQFDSNGVSRCNHAR